MKLFSANIEDLRALYIDDLQKALDMEQHITNALPKIIERSSDPELAEALANHLMQTQGHVARVESLVRDATCKVIRGLITEAEDTIKDVTDPFVLDVALIGATQQVEHHEIAVYGTLRNWAELLGLDDHADILESILEEEKEADEILSELSDTLNTTAEAVTRLRA